MMQQASGQGACAWKTADGDEPEPDASVRHSSFTSDVKAVASISATLPPPFDGR